MSADVAAILIGWAAGGGLGIAILLYVGWRMGR